MSLPPMIPLQRKESRGTSRSGEHGNDKWKKTGRLLVLLQKRPDRGSFSSFSRRA